MIFFCQRNKIIQTKAVKDVIQEVIPQRMIQQGEVGVYGPGAVQGPGDRKLLRGNMKEMGASS